MSRAALALGLALATGWAAPAPVAAQPRAAGPAFVTQPNPAGPAVVVTAAGERYRAGDLHRWVLGSHHRDLWAEPIRVEVLRLDEMAGGLIPLKTGGSMQTRSLRFLGADGREYTFRSVDKNPSAIVDSIFRGTVLADVVQDGISAAHPFGALVAAPLLEAVGVLHVEPSLRVMPDDPALGVFRDEFAGMLGLIEERPHENEGGASAFAGAEKIIGSEKLTKRLDDGPDDRIDARAYLKARLMDVFLGDWDRHRGQWRWATFDAEHPRRWLPIPRDRDQVFSNFDGAATEVASLYAPQLVEFGPEYPSIVRLHWNGRAIDRWFLAELDREAWDMVGGEVRRALTDAVIEDAVRRLPPEIYAIDGVELTATLKARRDRLPSAWSDFYRLLAEQVDLRATAVDDSARIHLRTDGSAEVTVAASRDGDAPWFRRRFLPDETKELRIHLRDGDDQVLVSGDAPAAMAIRIVGGKGDDRYVVHGRGDGIFLYDHRGNDVTVGPGAPPVDRRAVEEWVWSPDDNDQPRDWGHRTLPTFWSSYTSDMGPFLGAGARLERYGFRNLPYASAFELRGGFTPTLGKARLELEGMVHRSGSSLFWTMGARISGLDVLHYYGLGNRTAPGDEDLHRVDLGRISGSVGVGVSPEPWLKLTADLRVRHSSTRDDDDRFFTTLDSLYGDSDFTTLGIGARLVFDPLRDDGPSGHRFRLTLDGVLHPEAFDAKSAFGRAGGDMSALIASSRRPAVSLAVRAGARQVLGRFPWHEAAFIGGGDTVRGLSDQRYAGDASVYASGELRVRVARPELIVPTHLGLFGFGDTGRVWVDEASPGGWHTGVGGGLSLQPVGQPYLGRVGAAFGQEATILFLTVGLPY